jgi:hypothetical protein
VGEGEEEATQFSFVTTLPPDRGYRRSSIHMSVYLSIALDVSERPPSPPPYPASATYFILIKIDSDTDGLALVSCAGCTIHFSQKGDTLITVKIYF